MANQKVRLSNMRAIRTGSKYKIYDDSIQTYNQLPAATYVVGYNQMEGCFLMLHSDIKVSEKTYGIHNKKVNKVIKSFDAFDRSLGVILSGDKGIGKSIFAKMICERAVERNLPVIIVDACLPGIAHFIEAIDQQCVVLFDEFDKTFRSGNNNDEQAALLSLFDGTAGGKKLYIVTCNELYGLNDYIINRPGRFHYHFRFEYPSNTDISEYLQDKLDSKYYAEIDKVVAFAQKISLNYDCLRAIAFELNQGVGFKEAASDLNILNVNREEYNLTLYLEGGEILHQYRFRTNLFDNDGTYAWAAMYDNAGHGVLDVRFDKNMIMYDMSTNTSVIPAEGLLLDVDDYEEDDKPSKYRCVKAKYLSFSRCNVKNLHYAV